uniref:Bm14479 n=1 Tax=Brugia malayi TaxID=6279 RepID=A0A1I9G4F5_BRUMA|nr:Bm14479 [Brugia malayi]
MLHQERDIKEKRDKATNHWSHDDNLELINKQPWITSLSRDAGRL